MSRGWQSDPADGSKNGWRQRSVVVVVVAVAVAVVVVLVLPLVPVLVLVLLLDLRSLCVLHRFCTF